MGGEEQRLPLGQQPEPRVLRLQVVPYCGWISVIVVTIGEKERELTAGQQESPQQVSPALQKASEQQVEFPGMQNPAVVWDFEGQQISVFPTHQSTSY